MTLQCTAHVVTGLMILAASVAFGQAPAAPSGEPQEPEVSSEPPPSAEQLGFMIAIPVPEERKHVEKFEIPELAGARPATGSNLVAGRLPRPLVDYLVKAGAVSQKLSIFENGLVSVRVTGVGGEVRKKVILPEDALAEFRKWLNPSQLALAEPSDPGVSSSVSILRVYDDSGNVTERRFNPSTVNGAQLTRQKLLLEDLLQTIAEDREVTNSLANYRPAVGDRLIGDDRKIYEVTGLVKNGAIIELRSLSEPVTRYVSADDLPKQFVSARRKASH